MASIKTVLIVEDNDVNRKILKHILSDEYFILEAANGAEALAVLSEKGRKISAVVLDLIMPVMDGFEFLQTLYSKTEYKDLPVIVSTGNNSQEQESRALRLGAWDFVSKPYRRDVLKFRLSHAIERSQLAAFEKLKYLAEMDLLTGIYNKTQFYSATRAMLTSSSDKAYAFVRFDIDHFKLINSFYGTAEGDRFLRFIAEIISHELSGRENCSYGRIESDIFAFCISCDSQDALLPTLTSLVNQIRNYKKDFNIVPSFGIYYLDDLSLPVSLMLDRATLAARACKGSNFENFAVYRREMSLRLEQEQRITNEMQKAIDNGEFCLYLQPKYSFASELPCGCEALVRWRHPEKGLLTPGSFIPVFEKNGFITKLDYYVWDKVCGLIASWLKKGLVPLPVSVNISRVNLYNPQIVEIFAGLAAKYKVPPRLLQLELTESVYIEDSTTLKQVIKRLKDKGFSVHMDDFGTGFSSLSILKDISVDVLKIDLRFLETSDIPGRGESLAEAIISMAKRLNIPVVAEGVETSAQVSFLKSTGCEFAQGYYFEKPAPIEEYEKLIKLSTAAAPKNGTINSRALQGFNPKLEALFSDSRQPSCICGLELERVTLLQSNSAFRELFRLPSDGFPENPITLLSKESRTEAMNALHRCVEEGASAEAEVRINGEDEMAGWLLLKAREISSENETRIIYCSFSDLTAQKNLEAELRRYKDSAPEKERANILLLISEDETNCAELREIFKERYTVLEAKNAAHAIELLTGSEERTDLVMIDLMTPVAEESSFFKYKKDHKELADIPVVMITDKDSPEQQINTLAVGANDYIVRPFAAEIVRRRVENVLNSASKLREIVREYESAVEQAQYDPLTKLTNRQAAERIISAAMSMRSSGANALVMLDIDDFKQINDGYGHDFGDEVLTAFAAELRSYFRKNDMVARLGGDEFCVFLVNIPSEEFVITKCQSLIEKLNSLSFREKDFHINCSLGIAIADSTSDSFESVYRDADSALYQSKRAGKNRVSVYGRASHSITNVLSVNKAWLNDSLDIPAIIIDDESYEILYMSSSYMKLFGVEDYRGMKCYDILNRRESVCPFCVRSRLSFGSFHKWKHKNEILCKNLILKDKLINFYGRRAHLQMIADVEDCGEENQKQPG